MIVATPPDTIRTYETFAIIWHNADGSRSSWTNYDTRADAEAVIAFGTERGGRPGVVERRTFEHRIPGAHRAIYRGDFIAERIAP